MTTLERARQFFKRIHHWAGNPQEGHFCLRFDLDWWDAKMLECQARVARALIEQEARSHEACLDLENDKIADGLRRALDIIDAVYGGEDGLPRMARIHA